MSGGIPHFCSRIVVDVMKKVDFLIVGQGLAGSTLADTLLQAGARVLVVDTDRPAAASRVASGMWNPLTFRLLLKSWRADELLPVARNYYHDACARLGAAMPEDLQILRIFPDEGAALRWQDRFQDPAFAPYLVAEKPDASQYPALETKNGQGLVNQAGWLNLPSYLAAFRNHLQQQEALLASDFSPEDVTFTENGIRWKDIEASKIILCRGQFERQQPWFNWLPLKPAQGDVLTLHVPGLKLREIYNAGFFILPLGNDHYRVGATYEWDILSENPTENGKNELLQKFEAACSLPYQLVDHQAGIRPTVADRRPLLGAHPEYEQLVIFNGLGTKGVMIAPYFAHQLSQWLLGQGSIEDEVHVKRFRKRYEQQTGRRWNP